MCVCMNFSVRIPSSVCLLLAISYIAESVRGTRELDTATQAAHYINSYLTCVYTHHKTVVQTHQEMKYPSPLLFSTIHTSEEGFCSNFIFISTAISIHTNSASIMTISITTNRIKELRNSG